MTKRMIVSRLERIDKRLDKKISNRLMRKADRLIAKAERKYFS